MIASPTHPLDGAVNIGGVEALPTDIYRKSAGVSGLDSLAYHKTRLLHILALLVLASTFFVLWINTVHTPCPLDPILIYSPVNEAVLYTEKQFDGRMNSTSIFRGYPSHEVDAAWATVSITAPATRLTREQFLMSGGNDNTAAVRYRPEDGGGYMSQVDGYHHLHCLDLLRKYLRQEYYNPFDPSFNRNLRPHLGHCVDIIRQKLMCTSDLTMITYDWVPGLDDPQPNLNAIHQCMDYDRILHWSEEHSAHVIKGHVVMFGNATELPESPM